MSDLIDHATLRQHISYDPATGVMVWLIGGSGRYTQRKRARIAGAYHKVTGYGYVQINRRRYLIPRLAFFYMTGRWPNKYVVHLNGDPADNRWSNLTEAERPRAGVSKSEIYESVRWRTEEDTILLNMIRAGRTLVSTAEVLGRSLCSVKARKRKLKLAGFVEGVPK